LIREEFFRVLDQFYKLVGEFLEKGYNEKEAVRKAELVLFKGSKSKD